MKLKVQAKRPGFRRAGIVFSDKEPTYLDLAELAKKLTPEQIEGLRTDPSLVVVETLTEEPLPKDTSDLEGQIEDLKGELVSVGGNFSQAQKELAAVRDDLKAALETVEDRDQEIKAVKKDLQASVEAHGKTSAELDTVRGELSKAQAAAKKK